MTHKKNIFRKLKVGSMAEALLLIESYSLQ